MSADIDLNALFRRDFPAILEELERAGGHSLTVLEEFENRIGSGRTGTVIFKRVQDGRGFGAVWRIDQRRLEGLRGRTYDAYKPECVASKDFMAELARRLRCDARALRSVEGGGDYLNHCATKNLTGCKKPFRVYPNTVLRKRLARVAY